MPQGSVPIPPPGPRRSPTIRELAIAASVSPMTVSLALRNQPTLPVSTRLRIQKIAAEMGYRVNPLVSALMTHVRSTKAAKYTATLGIITAFPAANAWKLTGQSLRTAHGIKQRAQELGYEIDEFWLKEPGMTPRRLNNILLARGVHGLIIPGLNRSHGHLSLEWSHFSICALGYTLTQPSVHRAVNHQFQGLRLALRELRRCRYRRIGLAVTSAIEERTGNRWLAAMLAYQHGLGRADRVPLFLPEKMRRDDFLKWYARHSPEVIMGIDAEIVTWLEELGKKPGQDFGFVHLDWTPGMRKLTGVNQNPELVGAAAVDIVVAQLQRNERGIPAAKRITLIEGTWVEGATVRQHAPQ